MAACSIAATGGKQLSLEGRESLECCALGDCALIPERCTVGSMRALAAAIAVLLLAPTAAGAAAEKPRLRIPVAERETLRAQSLFADWRIREATHVPDPVYPDLYSPEEAAHWLRELALPSCERVARNIIDCVAEATVWDERTGQGETATWRMRTRRHRDERVRGGVVTITRLLDIREWWQVPVRAVVVAEPAAPSR